MIKFSIRTNRTRAIERAPLVIPPASAALLADLYQMVSKTHRKAGGSTKDLKKHQPGAGIPTTPTKPASPGAASVQRKSAVAPRFGSQSPASTPSMRSFQHNPANSNGSVPAKNSHQSSQANASKPVDQQQPRKPFQPAAPNGASPVKPSTSSAPRSDKPVNPQPTTSTDRPNQNGSSKPLPAPIKPSPASYNGVSGRNGLHNGSQVPHGTNGANNGTNGGSKTAAPGIYRPGMYPVKSVSNGASRPESAVQKPLITSEKASNGDASDAGQNGKPSTPPQPIVSPVRANPPMVRLSLAQGLEQLYKQHPGLPEQTAVLGVCDDGLPVLLNLDDPTPGAVVVVGDEREEQLDLLHSAVTSLASRNSPRSVQFMVISCNPETWKEWISAQKFDRYVMAVEGVEDVDVLRDWILRLADWTEQRRLGQRSGPPVVLIMDTLSFLPRLSIDVRLNFEWMAKEGPLAHIWQIAAISADLAQMLYGRRMLRPFKTRILGFADNAAVYTQLSDVPEAEAAEFGVPGEFAVQVGENWLRFKIAGRK